MSSQEIASGRHNQFCITNITDVSSVGRPRPEKPGVASWILAPGTFFLRPDCLTNRPERAAGSTDASGFYPQSRSLKGRRCGPPDPAPYPPTVRTFLNRLPIHLRRQSHDLKIREYIHREQFPRLHRINWWRKWRVRQDRIYLRKTVATDMPSHRFFCEPSAESPRIDR